MYVIDTINDGTLYLQGHCEERVQIGRYAADDGVAFPDLLNTVDEGQLQHTKLCLLSSKTNHTTLKWLKAHLQLSFSVTAKAKLSYIVIVRFFSALEWLSNGEHKISL